MNQDWVTVFEALKSVYTEDAYSNIAVNEAVSHHHGCRESFVRNMVKGTVRETLLLDHIIGGLAKSGISSIRNRTLIILRMGLYAIRSMESVPDHAAVNESVALARKTAKGTDRFINAVLRSYLRDRDNIEMRIREDEVRLSFPDAVAGLISEQYGEEADDILAGLNTPPPVVLRINTLKSLKDERSASHSSDLRGWVSDRLAEQGIICRASDICSRALIAEGSGIVSSDLYRDGWYTIQSLSSIAAVEALDPRPGQRILDMCAAPGGKSTLMAELMGDKGSITACDIYPHRLDLIRRNAERLGISCITARQMDGSAYDAELEGCFDAVLADVPCSGLGVIGSKPEIRFRTDPSGYEELREIQKKILINALRYARPGGRVEYSTCTLNRDENERLVQEAADSYGSVRLVEMKTYLPYNDMVGFYYCILEK